MAKSQELVVESADGHKMTLREATQTIYDFSCNHKIKIVIEGETEDMWGTVEMEATGYPIRMETIVEVQAEYSVAESLVAIAAGILVWEATSKSKA